MKIVQISDLHWRGLARHEEYTNAFNLLFEKIKEIKPDIIVNTGDIFHTKTQSISPEVVERMTWMFGELADRADQNITILGNHDGNLTNLSRKDIISTILEKQQHNESISGIPYGTHFSRDSVTHSIFNKALGTTVEFHCFSPFDKDGWKNRIPDPDKINIALFHGSVSGCVMDNGMTWNHGEIDVSDMNIFDFVLLGDIHQQQFMDYRLDKNGVRKPYMGYPGSLIQQNFGESITKGFYVWDIKSKDDWDVEFHELDNLQPFYTFSWVNNVKETIDNVLENIGKIKPGSRFRFTTREILPQTHTEALVHVLKTNYGAFDVVFKHEKDVMNDFSNHERLKSAKRNLRNNPKDVTDLFDDFMLSQTQISLSSEQTLKAHDQIKVYLEQYNNSVQYEGGTVGNQQWSPKWVEFGNLFRYGDNNRIDFEKHQGLVGLFGKNKIGKSSIIAAIMYALFNTTDRGSIKASDIINKRKNNCWAKVCFNHDGIDYVIERETTRTNLKDLSKSATKVNLFEIKQEDSGKISRIERNCISRDDTDKEIRRLIGTPEDFLMTSLASQGDIMRFINEGSTNRKKILNRFLDIDLFEKLYLLVKNEVVALNAKTKGFTIEDLSNKGLEIEKELGRIDYQIINTNQLKDKKSSQLEDVKNQVLSYYNKNKDRFATETSLANKQKNLDELNQDLEFITTEANRLTTQTFTMQRDLEIQEANFKLLDSDKLKEKLSLLLELKQKGKEVQNVITVESNSKNHLQKSVNTLDLVPCGDEYLGSCFFIKDSHEDKKKLTSINILLEELVVQQQHIIENISALSSENVESQLASHEQLRKSLNEKTTLLSTDLASLRAKNNEYEFKNDFKKKLVIEIDELKKVLRTDSKYDDTEFLNNKTNLKNLELELKSFDTVLADLYKNLGSYQTTLEINKSNIDMLEELNEKFTIYSSIQESFSKTGIPAMILKTQLPSINEELDKILMGVTDFKIVLENDLSSNSMDVYLEDMHSRRVIELGSGMEKTIASLAIRVALINISSIPRSDIFIVDEGFTALDEENMQSCLEMLNMLRTYFKSVLIISHEPAIKEVADRILEVKNDGIESKIEA